MMDAQLVTVKTADFTGGKTKRRDIREKLSLAHLPAMPQIMIRLLELCHRDDLNLGDLAVLISRDAGMVARIFAISNSAAYQRRSRPSTLDQCLSMLGVSMIKVIVINESVMQVFSRFTILREVDLNKFWEHSLRSALIARELARKMDYSRPDEAYLGGLVHDIGRLAMLVTDPEGYKRVFQTYEDGDELCAVEQELFGLTHAEVGAWLIEKWALDSFLGDCLLYHHEPVERIVSTPALVRIVLLANRLAILRSAGKSPPDWNLFALCGMQISHPEAMLDLVDREVVGVAEHFGIKLATPKESTPNLGQKKAAQDIDDLKFASRIQDILLVNQVLGDSQKIEGLDFPMQAIGLAMKVLFDLDAAFCFERIDGSRESFRARPLGAQHERISQLEFVRGRSASVLAKSLDAGPMLLMSGLGGLQLIDDQILRAVGTKGVLLLPLRTLSSCVGVMIAGITSEEQAATLHERLPCLAHFGRLSAEQLLEGTSPQLVPNTAEISTQVNHLIHELNNPLAIIRNYLALLEAENASKGSEHPELGIVRDEVDRIAKMLRLAHEQPAGKTVTIGKVNVNQVIEDLATLFRGSIPATGKMEIRVGLAEGLPEIISDRDQLKQLLVNLIKNALEAMPQGGMIKLTTAPWRGRESGLSHIEICIEDSGPGLPKEVLSSLYQQVVSDKGGEHQGVGLAIVGKLVHELSGLINCRSDKDGTHFQLLLPITHT